MSDDLADGPQGSFVQSYDGPSRAPFLPRDGFAIQAPDGFVSLVFSDAQFNACADGFDAGTSRVTLLVSPSALAAAGPRPVDVALDTVDASCADVRPASDAPAYAMVTIDAVDAVSIRGSYLYAYRGGEVSGSFDVAFCGGHPAGDDFACRW